MLFWVERSVSFINMEPQKVRLCELTQDNVADVVALKVLPDQIQLIDDNAYALSEAYVHRKNAWVRAICAGHDVVGLVMLFIAEPKHIYAIDGRVTYYLWHLMIDGKYQSKGYGSEAIKLVIDHIKKLPDSRDIYLMYKPDNDSAGSFYRKHGFVPTGEIRDGEVVVRLTFSQTA